MVEVGSPLMWAIGFIMGLEHAFDVDHVVAVSTIVSENKSLRKSLILGSIWGIGHTTMLFLVGLFVLTFKLMIPENIALLFEFAVGIMLVILGFLVIKAVILNKVHLHHHSHGKCTHTHFHSHKVAKNHDHAHKSLLVGMLQGLAGSAALLLLTLSTIESIIQGLLFILIFGMGTILGMLFAGALIGVPFSITAVRFNKINEKIRVTTGFLSIGLGVFIVIKLVSEAIRL